MCSFVGPRPLLPPLLLIASRAYHQDIPLAQLQERLRVDTAASHSVAMVVADGVVPVGGGNTLVDRW